MKLFKRPDKGFDIETTWYNGRNIPVVNETFCKIVLGVVDAGLSNGLGHPVPGQMCVEAAVRYASNEAHGDSPNCVHPDLASIKIGLNDQHWSSPAARAKGMRKLAIAQLGSAVSGFDRTKFWQFVRDKVAPDMETRLQAMLTAANDKLVAVVKGNSIYSHVAQSAAKQHAYDVQNAIKTYNSNKDVAGTGDLRAMLSSRIAIRDELLTFIADLYVEALIDQKLPGTEFLYLTEGSQTQSAVKARLRRRDPAAAKLASQQRKTERVIAKVTKKRVAKHK